MAKKIQLTQGKCAIVDIEDYEYLSQWKWYAWRDCNTFYAGRNNRLTTGKNTRVPMHHAIIGRPPTGLETDHKDGDGLNNQRFNLRQITHRQNGQNRKNQKATSQFPGVSWAKRDKKWEAYIRVNGKKKNLGLFEDELKAAQAHKKAIEEIGEVML